jgi:dolichol-phosphate mannosyltransferase
LHRAGKLGLGTAIVAAMRYAMTHDYDLLLNMDADFSHPPRYIPAMLAGMARRDVMIGSRYVPGGGTENWPVVRETISRAVNGLVRFFFRMGVRDASGAYRCYRVAKLRDVRFDRIVSRGYSFQQEMLYRCKLAGCTLGETPIIFENRRAGKSKVNMKEAARSMATIVYLGIRALLGIERHASRLHSENPT